MTQYQVPQFIDIEDRIVGPLTLKQFLYLAFGGAILFVSWFLFKIYLWVIVAVPVIALSMAFAFMKINDRPFVHFFLSVVNYYLRPKLYIFSVKPTLEIKEPKIATSSQSFAAPQNEVIENSKVTRSKLKELALSLDTRK